MRTRPWLQCIKRGWFWRSRTSLKMDFMVLIGIFSFLVPFMSKTWCLIPFLLINVAYPAGNSFCTSVLEHIVSKTRVKSELKALHNGPQLQ